MGTVNNSKPMSFEDMEGVEVTPVVTPQVTAEVVAEIVAEVAAVEATPAVETKE
jgi:hypothetical protein